MQLQVIKNKIYEIREQKVMLDFDLAELYAVPTKSLNLAVKRNLKRFPIDFMFQLTKAEWESLRFQIETSNGRGGTRYMPYAFTEQGVAMLSGILSSKKAIEVNIAIMRSFVLLRNYALSHKDLTEQLHKLESKYDQKFADIEEALTYLIQKDVQQTKQQKRKQIGYKIGK